MMNVYEFSSPAGAHVPNKSSSDDMCSQSSAGEDPPRKFELSLKTLNAQPAIRLRNRYLSGFVPIEDVEELIDELVEFHSSLTCIRSHQGPIVSVVKEEVGEVEALERLAEDFARECRNITKRVGEIEALERNAEESAREYINKRAEEVLQRVNFLDDFREMIYSKPEFTDEIVNP